MTLRESKMRSWKYAKKVDKIIEEIFQNKDGILKSDRWYYYKINEQFCIWTANHELFIKQYPKQTHSKGIMIKDCVIFYLAPTDGMDDIKAVIYHELEHAIDYRTIGQKEWKIEHLAYDTVNKSNSSEDKYLHDSIVFLLYRFWVKSERNAFISQYLLRPSDLNTVFDNALDMLKVIQKSDADKHSHVWQVFSATYTNRKNFSGKSNVSPRDIKRHFISQTYHKMKTLLITLKKKRKYAEKNSNGLANTSSKDFYYARGQEAVGPFDFSEIYDLVNNGTINNNTYIWRRGMAEWMRAYKCLYTQNMFK